LRQAEINKIGKIDQKELLLWIAACGLPEVNRERRALIEYLLGVVLSAKQLESTNKSVSRKEIEKLFRESSDDLEDYVDSFKNDMFLFSFTLGYLTIRGEALPWQLAQAAIERYEPHDEWMNKKLGFNVRDAVEFTKIIIDLRHN
jgi:hypothetical protein